MPSPTRDLTDDLKAALAARRELGPDHEEFLVASFLERVQRDLQTRSRPPKAHNPARLAVFGLIMAVPLSAIAGAAAGLPGEVIAWAGIVCTVFLGNRNRS